MAAMKLLYKTIVVIHIITNTPDSVCTNTRSYRYRDPCPEM